MAHFTMHNIMNLNSDYHSSALSQPFEVCNHDQFNIYHTIPNCRIYHTLFTEQVSDILILYHTIPNFNNPEKGGFRKHCGKRRKCFIPAFSGIPTIFSTLLSTNFIILICHLQNTFNQSETVIQYPVIST